MGHERLVCNTGTYTYSRGIDATYELRSNLEKVKKTIERGGKGLSAGGLDVSGLRGSLGTSTGDLLYIFDNLGERLRERVRNASEGGKLGYRKTTVIFGIVDFLRFDESKIHLEKYLEFAKEISRPPINERDLCTIMEYLGWKNTVVSNNLSKWLKNPLKRDITLSKTKRRRKLREQLEYAKKIEKFRRENPDLYRARQQLERFQKIRVPAFEFGIQPITGAVYQVIKSTAPLVDVILGFIPIVGTVIGTIDAIIDKSIITGENLRWYERLLGVIPVAGRVLKTGGEGLIALVRASNRRRIDPNLMLDLTMRLESLESELKHLKSIKNNLSKTPKITEGKKVYSTQLTPRQRKAVDTTITTLNPITGEIATSAKSLTKINRGRPNPKRFNDRLGVDQISFMTAHAMNVSGGTPTARAASRKIDKSARGLEPNKITKAQKTQKPPKQKGRKSNKPKKVKGFYNRVDLSTQNWLKGLGSDVYKAAIRSFAQIDQDIIDAVNRFAGETGFDKVVKDFLVRGWKKKEGAQFVMQYAINNLKTAKAVIFEMKTFHVGGRRGRQMDIFADGIRYELKSVKEVRRHIIASSKLGQLEKDIIDNLWRILAHEDNLKWVFNGEKLRVFGVKEIDVIERIEKLLKNSPRFRSYPRLAEIIEKLDTIITFWP